MVESSPGLGCSGLLRLAAGRTTTLAQQFTSHMHLGGKPLGVAVDRLHLLGDVRGQAGMGRLAPFLERCFPMMALRVAQQFLDQWQPVGLQPWVQFP